jgi:hypothetical protein
LYRHAAIATPTIWHLDNKIAFSRGFQLIWVDETSSTTIAHSTGQLFNHAWTGGSENRELRLAAMLQRRNTLPQTGLDARGWRADDLEQSMSPGNQPLRASRPKDHRLTIVRVVSQDLEDPDDRAA